MARPVGVTRVRVVSLLPAATEMLYAIGVEPVAVSCACDHPPEVREKPVADRSPIDPDADSASINDQVASAEDAFSVREDVLCRVGPDVVVAQEVCDVCAIDGGHVERVVGELGSDADVVTIHAHTVDGVLADVETLGTATGREGRAREVVRSLERRIESIESRVEQAEEGPRVAVLDWLDPVMVAGHWVPELVERAGGTYGMVDAGATARPREFHELAAYDPEVVILAPCGFSLEQARRDLSTLTAREGWTDLAAVEADEVYAIDGNHYLNRPGPRLVDAFGFLAWILAGVGERPPADAVVHLADARTTAE